MRRRIIAISIVFLVLVSFVFAGSSPILFFEMPLLATQQQSRSASGNEGGMIDLKSDDGYQREIGGQKMQILVGNVAAHHNGAVITCDSAVRRSETHLECFGQVLINKGTTYVYGDRAEYDRETGVARVYSDIVKVVDGDATLYSYNFRFNTKTNIGEFRGGGIVIKEDNLLEADRGRYNSATKDIICYDAVEMRNETYEMKGDSVIFNIDTNNAQFFTETNIWNTENEEYLYTDCGSYNKDKGLYILTRSGYILTREQEAWSDSLDYYRESGYALMRGNVQLDDTEQKMMAFGDWCEYWKEPGDAFLTKNPSLISYDLSQGDSVFMRSDSMYIYTRTPARDRAEKALADSLLKVQARADSIAAAAKVADSVAKAASAKAAKRGGGDSKRSKHESAQSETANESVTTSSSQEDIQKQAQVANDAAKRGVNAIRESGEAKTEDAAPQEDVLAVAPKSADATETPSMKPNLTDSIGVASVADTLTVDSLAQDSLRDSIALNPQDTLTKAELRKILRDKAKATRDSIKRVKAKALAIKLDSIGERRQAKRTAMYRRMEAADSARRAKAEGRAAERVRRSLAKLTKKGITIPIIADSIRQRIDSTFNAEYVQLDTTLIRLYDSLMSVFYPQSIDSLSGDTIVSDSLYRLIKGYRRVKIFRTDFQTVCDSMAMTSVDSVIHLYYDPVLWNESNQITSEKMRVITRNQQALRAEFEGKPMTVSEIDTIHYNQISGKEMVAHFRDNQIYRNDVNGNVCTIYYVEEGDPAEITMMTYIESADMSSYIEDKKVVGITYRGNPTYTFYPMDKIPPERSLFLEGYRWEASRRPARDSVFNREIRPSLRAEKEALEHPKFPIAKTLNDYRSRLVERRIWRDRTDTLSAETHEWLQSLMSVY